MTVRAISALSLSILMSIGLSDASVSYIRWGRSVCPAGTVTLYKGYMVGAHLVPGGHGANFLCTHDTPVFVRGEAKYQGSAGALWGVEFERGNLRPNLFKTDNVPSGELHNQDMPCVRCYVAEDSDMMMVPGRPDCGNSGYNLQYKGFIMAQLNTNTRQRSEYVCIDEAPEGITGGIGNNDQAVIYPIEYVCGSLPCSPYVDGMEATCAVCTY